MSGSPRPRRANALLSTAPVSSAALPPRLDPRSPVQVCRARSGQAPVNPATASGGRQPPDDGVRSTEKAHALRSRRRDREWPASQWPRRRAASNKRRGFSRLGLGSQADAFEGHLGPQFGAFVDGGTQQFSLSSSQEDMGQGGG